MKVIVIGASLSGKTTIIKYLLSQKNLPISEVDDELIRLNKGIYPTDVDYKHKVLIPKIIKEILNKDRIIFFTNTDYFTEKDLITAKHKGFKIFQLDVDLKELKKRNRLRVNNEGRDDWGKWLEGMVKYQQDIREKGLIDKVIRANKQVEVVSKELLDLLQ